MEEDDHPNMRVCMVGNAQVGKTSLVSQFVTSEHMKDFDASLGECLLCKEWKIFINFSNFCS